MKSRINENVFIQGPITAQFIAHNIGKFNTKTDIGAHDIFLGQVRADYIDGKSVVAIKYEAYEEMAVEQFDKIREVVLVKHDIIEMHIYHSLGIVKAGEICLFVFVSSKHRRSAFEACQDIVEQIKFISPIWGKEILEDDSHTWKVNTLK